MSESIDTAALVICAVIGAGWIFLLFFGENVSRWIRTRREDS